MAERIAVIGRNGQLAREIAGLVWPHGHLPAFLGRGDISFTDRRAARTLIAQLQPRAILNTAAYTDVDRAEIEPEAARLLNAEIPALLADIAHDLGIPLVHVSTDYVFSGSRKTPWREDDVTLPISTYGKTKRAGEIALLNHVADSVVVRTSGIFGRCGRNFLKTIVRLSMDATRHEIPVVMDQVTTPTPAAGLAAALRQLVMDRIAGRDLPALLHFAGQPATDWFTFSKAIVLALAEAGVARLPAIVPVLSTEHPRTALRPAYSALDCSCATALGYEVPGWLPSLPPLIAAFCEKRIAA